MAQHLGRVWAALVGAAVVVSSVIVSAPAQAATYQVSGVIQNYDGTSSGVEIVACRTDCFNGSGTADDYTYMSSSTGTFTLDLPATGTYYLGVSFLSLEHNYGLSDGAVVPDGYLTLAPGASMYSVSRTLAGAKTVAVTGTTPVNVGTLRIGQAIHNPLHQFSQNTPGTVGEAPCAGHTTTVRITPFSDLPADATLTYQWYIGTSASTRQPIPGATGVSYTSTAAQVGQQMWVAFLAQAPNRVAFDAISVDSIGTVGNPANCNPRLATIKRSWIKSFGTRHGKAVHGKKVYISGARATSKKYRLRISYTWSLNGVVVHSGARFKIPANAKGKRLVVKVSFTRPGFAPKSKVFQYGRVR